MIKKRNLVLISLDSVRADHCSFMGYKRRTTPFLEEIMEQGLKYENAIAPSSWTLPSMKGVFTGEFFNDYPTDMMAKRKRAVQELRRQVPLPYLLSRLGYSTAAFNPNPHASKGSGFDLGFDYFEDYTEPDFWDSLIKGDRASHVLLRKVQTLKNFLLAKGGLVTWEHQYARIMSWMQKAKEPFFVWIFLLDTHIPYSSTRSSRKWSSNLDYFYNNLRLWTKIGSNEADYGRVTFSSKEHDKLVNLYDDSILYADAFLKRLWNDTKRFDPIFIIHADHGEGFGEHGFYSHARELYEELIHVPFLILNGEKKGIVSEPTSLLDIPSIILRLVGAKPSLNKSPQGRREPFAMSRVFESGSKKLCIRGKEWKLILRDKGDDELYNLRTDPSELNNVIQRELDITLQLKELARKQIDLEEKSRIKSSISKLVEQTRI